MDNTNAVQAAANAIAVATQAINDYAHNPDTSAYEAVDAYQTALNKVAEARAAGATDTDLRTTRPA